jgi:hypothetical protein
VILAQRLLNAVPHSISRPMPVLEDRGICTPATLSTIDTAYPPARTWVPFKRQRPRPGEISILQQLDKDELQHIGMIVNADGGQGNGHQSGVMRRQFKANGEITGESGKTARLKGWADLDALWAVVVAQSPIKDLAG